MPAHQLTLGLFFRACFYLFLEPCFVLSDDSFMLIQVAPLRHFHLLCVYSSLIFSSRCKDSKVIFPCFIGSHYYSGQFHIWSWSSLLLWPSLHALSVPSLLLRYPPKYRHTWLCVADTTMIFYATPPPESQWCADWRKARLLIFAYPLSLSSIHSISI